MQTNDRYRTLCALYIERFCLVYALKWIMHGRNSVNIILNRCAHVRRRRRSGARDIHLTAFLRNRVSRFRYSASLVCNRRGNRFCRHTPVRPLTRRQYDTILIIPGTKSGASSSCLCISRTSVRLTRHGAIYLIYFLIGNKNLKNECIIPTGSLTGKSASTFSRRNVRSKNIKMNYVKS